MDQRRFLKTLFKLFTMKVRIKLASFPQTQELGLKKIIFVNSDSARE